MTERRDPDQQRLRPKAPDSSAQREDAGFLDLQRSAGNRAVADLLSSPAIRLRDTLRSGVAPVQREFGLDVQRLEKDEIKQPGRLLKSGSRGGDVAMVQQMLGVDADGSFGRNTRNRVIEFQVANGLVPDGIVGPLTFAALVSATAGTGKLAPTTDKQAAMDKLKPATEDKLPSATEDKMPPSSTDKLPSGSTDKLDELKQ
jgi:peptidoglycan hydrolase-like protein with peptidoglycan-binding domain